MDVKKEDRRVIRTKQRMLTALSNLLTTKKISQITVKELADLADVNRATFYFYYNNIPDMLDKVEQEMFVDFQNTCARFREEQSSVESTEVFLTRVFQFLKDNADMAKILLGPSGDYSFIEKLKNAIGVSKPEEMTHFTSSQKGTQYFNPFIVSGCIGMIQYWLRSDMPDAPSEMAYFTLNLILKGRSFLEEQHNVESL